MPSSNGINPSGFKDGLHRSLRAGPGLPQSHSSKAQALGQQMNEWLVENGHDAFTARPVTDSAPFLEKRFAEQSGLGWIGKHTLHIRGDKGSYHFLGELLTNIPFTASHAASTNHCGSCARCIEICPTQAIVGPYQLDARRCIAYLTIEHQGAIPEELRAPMGNRVFDVTIAKWFAPGIGTQKQFRLKIFCQGTSSISHHC